MKDKVFIETNVLVYLFDKAEPEKRNISIELLKNLIIQEKILCISVQVVNEFISALTKKVKNPIPLELIKRHLNFIDKNFIIYPLNFKLSIKGIDIKIRYKFNFYDCVIIAAALENNCNVLYSEDLQDGQIIEGTLKIVNPFKSLQ